MSGSNRSEIPRIEDSSVESIDMIDRDFLLVRFANGITVAVELEKFKQFTLHLGQIVEWDLPYAARRFNAPPGGLQKALKQ